jgi:hypothetical protein
MGVHSGTVSVMCVLAQGGNVHIVLASSRSRKFLSEYLELNGKAHGISRA